MLLTYEPTQGDSMVLKAEVAPGGAVPEITKAGEPPAPFALSLTDTDSGQRFEVGERQATLSGYHRHLDILLETPSGQLRCRLEGPGRHTLQAPLQGQVVRAGQDLPIRWQTGDGLAADEVEVKLELAGYSVALRRDRGQHVVPGNLLRQGNETVRVLRRNRVAPRGGGGGSQVRMEYQVAVSFAVL